MARRDAETDSSAVDRARPTGLSRAPRVTIGSVPPLHQGFRDGNKSLDTAHHLTGTARHIKAALLLGASLMLLAAPSAQAVTREQVLSALGVDAVPADYVLVVDTSRSMQQGNRYGKATAAIGQLLRAVSPKDHLSLITFDATPALRYTGTVGQGQRATGQLPGSALGGGTDIGAALQAALDELERPDAAGIGTVVLMTDGKHNPPTGSAYPRTTGAPWAALGPRGRAVRSNATIAAYALGLRAGSDAALLKRAFPNASIVALPPNQLSGFLNRVKEQTRIAKARRLVAADRGRGIAVEWPTEQLRQLDLTEGKATVDVVFRSRLRAVPVTLRAFELNAEGVAIKGSGLPDSVTLRPGQRRSIPVKLSFEKRGGPWFGKKTVTEEGTISLTAKARSPWASVLRKDLQASVKPDLAANRTRTRATGEVGRSWWTFGVLVLLLLSVAGYTFFRRRRRYARLGGTLQIQRTMDYEEVPLGGFGRKAVIGPDKDISLDGARGKIRAKRTSGPDGTRQLALLVELSAGPGSKQNRELFEGDNLTVGDTTVTYGL